MEGQNRIETSIQTNRASLQPSPYKDNVTHNNIYGTSDSAYVATGMIDDGMIGVSGFMLHNSA